MLKPSLFFLLSSTVLWAKMVSIVTPDGELMVDLEQHTTSSEVVEMVQPLLGETQVISIELDQTPLVFPQTISSPGSSIGQPREYYRDVTPSEKADLRFIVVTLADRSIVSLALTRGDLEAAGDRIAHLHPLRFLMTIFTDEELKVGIRNIRGKGWIWGQFLSGLKQSLVTENSVSNIRHEHVVHFARVVGINPSVIWPAVAAQDWDKLVELLMAHVPRSGEQDRYDM